MSPISKYSKKSCHFNVQRRDRASFNARLSTLLFKGNKILLQLKKKRKSLTPTVQYETHKRVKKSWDCLPSFTPPLSHSFQFVKEAITSLSSTPFGLRTPFSSSLPHPAPYFPPLSFLPALMMMKQKTREREKEGDKKSGKTCWLGGGHKEDEATQRNFIYWHTVVGTVYVIFFLRLVYTICCLIEGTW